LKKQYLVFILFSNAVKFVACRIFVIFLFLHFFANKMGDMITVFGNTGNVHDIGLLNCDLLMKDGNIVRIPSTSLLTTPITIILQAGDSSKTQKQQPSETSTTK
jgi:small-conductance mechanosensitive channel